MFALAGAEPGWRPMPGTPSKSTCYWQELEDLSHCLSAGFQAHSQEAELEAQNSWESGQALRSGKRHPKQLPNRMHQKRLSPRKGLSILGLQFWNFYFISIPQKWRGINVLAYISHL